MLCNCNCISIIHSERSNILDQIHADFLPSLLVFITKSTPLLTYISKLKAIMTSFVGEWSKRKNLVMQSVRKFCRVI
ncbi:hypothetical protein VNO80_28321 [Phaseolus coccineus]|uniref:Uncharacterized protein n=1 Tax=Phaseolus coccineus TaxID=3886 RepID=A0AAN9LC60_PHACN